MNIIKSDPIINIFSLSYGVYKYHSSVHNRLPCIELEVDAKVIHFVIDIYLLSLLVITLCIV